LDEAAVVCARKMHHYRVAAVVADTRRGGTYCGKQGNYIEEMAKNIFTLPQRGFNDGLIEFLL